MVALAIQSALSRARGAAKELGRTVRDPVIGPLAMLLFGKGGIQDATGKYSPRAF
jgi:hypothetical protein